MNYVRRAIYAKLEADAALLALLGSADNASMVGDREATPSTLAPFLVVSFDGGRASFRTGYQTWAIYCEHNKDPQAAANILKLVKNDLNGQILSVSADGGVACLECWFMSDTPSHFDKLLRKDVDGKLFRVFTRDI